MKHLIVIFLFALASYGQKGQSDSDESPGYSSDSESTEGSSTPRRPSVLSEQAGQLEITPGSDFRGRSAGRHEGETLRDVLSFFGHRTAGDPRHAIYLITTGEADLTRLPIWDLGNRVLDNSEIEVLLASIVRHLRERDFFRYVGIMTRGIFTRATEHRRATVTNPFRRLPLAILNENQAGNPAHMHVLLTGVNPRQIQALEARLIRALDATGPRGLNGNTGHLETPERGIRGQLELTPSTATPMQGTRAILHLGERGEIRPARAERIPAVWQDIVYLITPPGLPVNMPIIDLQGRQINEDELQAIELRLGATIQEMDHERYVGMASAGLNRDRTPQNRAKEHERASLEHPYRRLPLAITRFNQENGAAQMHVLLAGVHPEQIEWIEGRLIRLFGGTGSKGWNSNPGKLVEPIVTKQHRRDDPEDPDLDRLFKPRGLFGGFAGFGSFPR